MALHEALGQGGDEAKIRVDLERLMWGKQTGTDDRLIRASSYTPTGIRDGPWPAFPQVKGPIEHVVAGEGFEPSKLSRWIYSP